MYQGMDAIHLLSSFPGVSALKGMKSKLTETPPPKDIVKAGVPKDVFLLSPSAQQLSDFFASQEALDAELNPESSDDFDMEGLKTKGEMLSELLKTKLATFQSSLMKSLQQSGIDPSEPLNLQGDKSGNVSVTNQHPDKAEIEEIFKKDMALSQQFRDLSMLSEIVKTRKIQGQSGDPGSMTPIAQMLRNSSIDSSKFSLLIRDGNASISSSGIIKAL